MVHTAQWYVMAGIMNANRIEPLSKDNYDTWRLQIEALLIKNDAWGYVNGTKVKPQAQAGDTALQTPEQIAWSQADQKAKSDLILAISPSELQHARGCETSHELWRKLESVYASKGPARKATLLKQLTLQKLSEGGNVREHIMRFFDAVDKLDSMSVNIHKDMLAILLLYSLPSAFENFRCAIESRDELPDPDLLKVKILEESEARLQKNDESTTGAFMARPKKKFIKKKIESKNDSKPPNVGKFQVRCYTCNKLGHKSPQCQQKGGERKCRNPQTDDTYLAHVSDKDPLAFQASYEMSRNKWCLDSGCTVHLCKDETQFAQIGNTEPKSVNLANNSSVSVAQTGVVKFTAAVADNKRHVKLTDVLHVPGLRANLMSVAKITDRGNVVIFKRNNAIVKDPSGEVKLVAERKGDLFFIRQSKEYANMFQAQNSALQSWHKKLGHLNYKDVVELSKRGVITKFDTRSTPNECDVCLQGKMTALPFSEREERSTEVLEIVHVDLCGPMRTESQGKAKYFITFTDDFTRWCEVRFLSSKKDVLKTFKDYKSMVEKQTGKYIKHLQSDNGKEFCSKEFDDFLHNEGIRRRLSVAYTPQQNGVAERKNRTLVEMARCMIIESKTPTSFWAEAVAMANHIRNRCPTKSLNGGIPFELWTGKKVRLQYVRPFGIKAYVLNKLPNKDKFAPRGKCGMLVGYSEDVKGYRIWIPNERKVTIARDVKFMNSFSNEGESEEIPSSTRLLIDFETIDNGERADANDTTPEPDLDAEETYPEEGRRVAERPGDVETMRAPGRPRKVLTGRKGRPRKEYQLRPVRNRTDQQQDEEENQDGIMDARESDSIDHAVEESDDEVFVDADEAIACFSEITMQEAVTGPNAQEWKEAIYSEVKSLIDNGTWDIVRRPNGKNVVTCRTVLTNKRGPDGSIVRRKARIVARGFSQRLGVDFNETFAPVARMSSIRMILGLAAQYDLKLHQLDVETAYLNGYLEEEVYMEKPDFLKEMLNMIISREDKRSATFTRAKRMLAEMQQGNEVCRLRKALYGLRQAGRQWHATLNKKLLDLGLKATNADTCVYSARHGKDVMLLLVYVDDIIIASSNGDWTRSVIQDLQKDFKVRDLGPARYCLGIEIEQAAGKVSISQRRYIEDVLHRFGMDECNPVSTPLDAGSRLVKDEQNVEPEKEKRPYRELVGALMYLATSTRPDIAHSMSVLSQFNDCHNATHWKAAKRVLRYLKGTSNYSIIYRKADNRLTCYVDADWAGCAIDRRSYTGYSFLFGGAAISWESRKQRTVALSSTEAEYMAIAEAVKEAIYLKNFLHEAGFGDVADIVIFNDNRGANLLTRNSVFHHRTKHIDMRYHFIRDALKRDHIKLEYLPTNEMTADVLTKSLPQQKHIYCVNRLGIFPRSNFSLRK